MTSVFGRYLIRLVLSQLALVITGLAAVMLFVDFLSDGDQVIADSENVFSAVARYSLLRLPAILSQIFPLATFLAGLLCFTALARHGELAALQAAGLSKFRTVVAVLPAALLIAVTQYLVEDLALPAANQALRDWGVGDYAPDRDGGDSYVWVRKGEDILRYSSKSDDARRLAEVTVFKRDSDGNLTEKIEARTAVYENGQWTLEDGRLYQADRAEPEAFARLPWTANLTPRALESITRHPRETPLTALMLTGGDSGIGNRPPYLYDLWLQERFARPLTTVLMLLLTIALARPALRDQGSGVWFAVAVGIGFLLWTMSGLFLALGELGLLAPIVAAWMPALILVLIGLWLALHIEYHVAPRQGRSANERS